MYVCVLDTIYIYSHQHFYFLVKIIYLLILFFPFWVALLLCFISGDAGPPYWGCRHSHSMAHCFGVSQVWRPQICAARLQG